MVMDELQIRVQILENLEMKLLFHELLNNEKCLDDGNMFLRKGKLLRC